MTALSSASGLLTLLAEPSCAVRIHALQCLDRVVHEFWYQISASIASVEALYEDEEFEQRELAAIVASKVSAVDGCLSCAFTAAVGQAEAQGRHEQDLSMLLLA